MGLKEGFDGIDEEGVNGEDGHFLGEMGSGVGNGGGGNESVDKGGESKFLQGVGGIDEVGDGGGDLAGTPVFKGGSGSKESVAGLNQIVDDDDIFTLGGAGKIDDVSLIGDGPAFFDDDEVINREGAGKFFGASAATGVGSANGSMGRELILEVAGKQGDGGEVGERQVKEGGDGGAVKIEGNDVIGTTDFDELGKEAGVDGLVGSLYAIGLGVTKVREEEGDFEGLVDFEGVDEGVKLKKVFGGRVSTGQDETVLAANGIGERKRDLAIGKAAEVVLGNVERNLGSQGLGEGGVVMGGKEKWGHSRLMIASPSGNGGYLSVP